MDSICCKLTKRSQRSGEGGRHAMVCGKKNHFCVVWYALLLAFSITFPQLLFNWMWHWYTLVFKGTLWLQKWLIEDVCVDRGLVHHVAVRVSPALWVRSVTWRTTTIPLLTCFPLSDAITLATSSLNKLLAKCVNLVWSNLSFEASTGPIVILCDNGFLKVAVINVDMNG